MPDPDFDPASFLERRRDEPVVMWYASTRGDPRDMPWARFDLTLVEAIRHLKTSTDITAFDIDMTEGGKLRLGQERVKALMALAGDGQKP